MNDSYRMSVTIGTIGVTKDNAAIQGLQVALSPYQTRNNVPAFGLHGVVSRPLPGARAATIMPGGDPNKAVVIGTNDQRYYLPGLPDGTVGLAHHLGASILFYADRIEVQGAGKLVVVKNASKVRIEGNLEVTGEVTAMCDAGAVHLSTHKTSDVQTGGSESGPPVPNT